MRIKDRDKQEALFLAAVKVVNEIGFASSSVSKIAKEAGVSPATLYIYHKNKDDLLISTYLNIKRKLTDAVLGDMDDSLPIRDGFRRVWLNLFRFAGDHLDYFQFAEQFSNSPYNDQVDQDAVDAMYEPMGRLIRRGIREKVVKDMHPEVISSFVFYPVIILSNPRLTRRVEMTEALIEESFQLAWDAIKL
ncbi:transcriptional regulator, TetR family [Desulfatibacillum alkenivorans DSM 16219]|jgi:AcrR family transcriptional regulator|uniref:Transcriptional regulator, TetR family n=1 Tax=Desulfatibacillum alkenivorans DSM 16219 TaxID=1121393 RepID=A0A1M6T6R4_9BACT|nr:TetR/AcrR family transcriptional regulator [Desulfatibacillum alkenivorans]SHK52691.1 transcriptional regulator, TetR family [Desulfatibacillum alkenivorans DSM 16219]